MKYLDLTGLRRVKDKIIAMLSSKQDKLTAGSNITIAADGKTISATDTTYSNATTSSAGLMSSTDKTKLDGIANGATANTGTITGITMNGASKGTSGVVDLGTVITSHQDISGKQNTLIAGTNISIANDGKTISATDTTYSDATTTTHGLMSVSDKIKLNGLGDIVYLIDTGSDISTFTNSGTYLIDTTLDMSYTYMSGPSGNQIRRTTLIPLYKGDILFCSMDSTYIYWTIYAYADNKKWIVKCTKSTGYSTGNYSTLLDNGTNFIIINGSDDTRYSYNTAWAIQKVNFNQVLASSGDKLTFNTTTKKIVVGSGVNYVRISGLLGLWEMPNTHIEIQPRKNDSSLRVIYHDKHSSSGAESRDITPFIVPVQEGDTIDLAFSSGYTGTYTLLTRPQASHLMVEVLS